MWLEISEHIAETTLENFEIKQRQSVTGGDINQSYYLTDGQREFFAKINRIENYEAFAAEAFSLSHIADSEAVRTPMVICYGQTEENSYLILEWCPLASGSSQSWKLLGEQLATMHSSCEQAEFGWDHNNFIGYSTQPNHWQNNWRTFFSEQRIGWQLQLLKEKSIRLGDIDNIVEVCHKSLLHHKVSPCLVHGDLWQGNVGFIGKQPIIFDPASYYGDREVDIAMTELFGQFPSAFYQGYQSLFPLPAKYEHRKLVYNLYHILNHANLFGGVYIEQCRAVIGRIIANTTQY